MSGPFEITTPSNTVTLDDKRQGVATFTVKNISRRRLRASGKVVTKPADSPSAKWIAILGSSGEAKPEDALRDFSVDESKQYQVKIAPPADAPSGSYTFKLVMAEELNPDDNFTESADMVYTVPEPVKQEPKKLPAWLIPLIVFIALVVIIGVIVTVVITNNQRNIDATSTAVAEAITATANATATGIAAGTLTAMANGTATAQVIATQTASSLQTLSAQNATIAVQQTATTAANMTATAIAQAMTPYLGNWVPVGGGLPTLNIARVDDHTLSFEISNCAPPDANFCLANGASVDWGVKNVSFTPPSLQTVFGSATLVSIQPVSSSQLGLLIAPSGGSSTPFVMQRSCTSRFCVIGTVQQFQQIQVNPIFAQIAPTPTP